MKAGVNIMNEVRGAQYKKPYSCAMQIKLKGKLLV